MDRSSQPPYYPNTDEDTGDLYESTPQSGTQSPERFSSPPEYPRHESVEPTAHPAAPYYPVSWSSWYLPPPAATDSNSNDIRAHPHAQRFQAQQEEQSARAPSAGSAHQAPRTAYPAFYRPGPRPEGHDIRIEEPPRETRTYNGPLTPRQILLNQGPPPPPHQTWGPREFGQDEDPQHPIEPHSVNHIRNRFAPAQAPVRNWDPRYPWRPATYAEAVSGPGEEEDSGEWSGTTAVESNRSWERTRENDAAYRGEQDQRAPSEPQQQAWPRNAPMWHGTSYANRERDTTENGPRAPGESGPQPEEPQRNTSPVYVAPSPRYMSEEHDSLSKSDETMTSDSESEDSYSLSDEDGAGRVRVYIDGDVHIELFAPEPLDRVESCLRAMPSMRIRGSLYIRTSKRKRDDTNSDDEDNDKGGYEGDYEDPTRRHSKRR